MCLNIACPRCGYHPEPGSEVQSLPGPQTQDAIASIGREIDLIERTISDLQKQKAAHYRTLNDLQSHPRVVPPEVLSHIFTFACPPSAYNAASLDHWRRNRKIRLPPVLIVSAVSSAWREVAISSPRLWTKVDWIEIEKLYIEDIGPRCQTFFSRAGNLPVDLKLSINPPPKIDLDRHEIPTSSEWFRRYLDEIKQVVIIENGHKIGKLDLKAPVEYLSLLEGSGSLTQIVDISFQCSVRAEGPGPSVDLSVIPSLRHFTCKHVQLLPRNLPWSHLHTVHLREANVKVCWDILTQCPNLIEFHSAIPFGHPPSPLSEAVTFHRMEWLDWSSTESPGLWDFTPFEKINLPSLSRLSLVLTEIPVDNDDQAPLGRFLARIPASCDHFELECMGPRSRHAFHFPHIAFSTMPHIKQLKIDGLFSLLADTVIQLLRPNSTTRMIKFPNLEILSLRAGAELDYTFRYSDSKVFLGDKLLEMVKLRRDSLHITRFRINLRLGLTWSENAIAGFQAMAREGFDIVIMDGYDRYVDWLPAVSL